MFIRCHSLVFCLGSSKHWVMTSCCLTYYFTLVFFAVTLHELLVSVDIWIFVSWVVEVLRVLDDCWSYRLVVLVRSSWIVNLFTLAVNLIILVLSISLVSFDLLFNHSSLRKVCHRWSNCEVSLLSIVLHPIICRVFKLNHTLLKQLFIMNQPLHFKIWVFPCVLFKHLKTFSDVFVLVLKLKYFTVLFVDQLWLFLNSFSKT